MLDSKFKGNLTELLCLAAFTELGYQISIPYGDHARYDLIADINNKKKYDIKKKNKKERNIKNGKRLENSIYKYKYRK